MKYQAEIIVKLKMNVRDAKGQAVSLTLENIEYAKNVSCRVGSFYELSFSADNIDSAKKIVNKTAKNMLSNPIIENYEIISIKQA